MGHQQSRFGVALVAALGSALLISPTGPAPPMAAGIGAACPSDVIVLAEFSDVTPSDRHARAIDCIAHWGLDLGEQGAFAPNGAVTSHDLSSALDQVRELVGVTGGTTLAFSRFSSEPSSADGAALTRAQLARALIAFLEETTGTHLPPRPHGFVDVDETAWTVAAKMSGTGIVPGLTGERFEPTAEVSRAWFATFLARTLDHLVRLDLLQVPAAPAFEVPPGRLPHLPLPEAPPYSYRLDVPLRDDGTPARFNPCSPVRVVANFEAAPEEAEASLRTALERISAATGTKWVFEGPTDERLADAFASRASFQPARYGHRWAPVLVNWPDPWTEPGVLGLAGSRMIDGAEIVTGDVRVNPESGLSGEALSEVLMHELAHVAGLGHVDDTTQVMRHRLESGAVTTTWGPGDLAALARVGRGSGCFHSAPPG